MIVGCVSAHCAVHGRAEIVRRWYHPAGKLGPRRGAAPIGSLLAECYSSVVPERPFETTVRTAQLFAANLQGISGGSTFCNSWLENT